MLFDRSGPAAPRMRAGGAWWPSAASGCSVTVSARLRMGAAAGVVEGLEDVAKQGGCRCGLLGWGDFGEPEGALAEGRSGPQAPVLRELWLDSAEHDKGEARF
jgi:hypothetical protein